jgi:ketosteroid isomerase-like protein
MDRAAVMTWVQGYEQAWRDNDASAVTQLFTEDARYRRSPYWPPMVGHAPLAEFWTEDEGATFTMSAEPVAVDGDVAVVRVQVNYGGDSPQEYTDLWLMHFAGDGRVDDFEEWAYWPDKPYTAADSGSAR